MPATSQESSGEQIRSQSKHAQIRVKSIEYLQEQATAIYFYDISSYFEAGQLDASQSKQSMMFDSSGIDHW